MTKFFNVFLSIIVTIMLFTANQHPVIAAQQGPDEITTLPPQADGQLILPQGGKPSEIGVSHQQAIVLHKTNLDALANRLRGKQQENISAMFHVFEDLTVTANFQNYENTLQNGYLLSGPLMEDPQGWINLVATGDTISADLEYQGQQYQLRRLNSGAYIFQAIDQSQFPQELDGAVPDEISFSQSNEITNDVPQADSGALIDVMVLYTTAAKLGAGGTNNILNTINLAVSETNDGYARSNIAQRMRLVHTEEVDYSETNLNGTSLDWYKALDNLTSKTDGKIDQIHALRDTYRADLVVMLVNDVTYCGLAWLMKPASTSFESMGFSVVSRSCATGYYSFGHETGHNMGAHHDRYSTNDSGAYSYSYGYQAPDNSFRTVMAYNCPSGYCPRINNWSNPDIYYNGKPTGVSASSSNSADNHLTLNNTAVYVANFRQALPPQAPSDLVMLSNSATTISLGFTDNSLTEEGFLVERSVDGTTWNLVSTLPKNTSSFTDSSLTCDTSYRYRVSAYDLNSTSQPSDPISVSTAECTPPAPPSSIQYSSTINSISIVWDDVEGETAYILEQSLEDTKSWVEVIHLDADTTIFVINDLEPESSLTLRITVENDYGVVSSEPFTVETKNNAVFIPMISR